MNQPHALSSWTKSRFTAGDFTRDTYRKGTGPAVVVVHEIPGITPAVQRFAEEVVDAGFTVVMPNLVGTPGREVSPGYLASSMRTVPSTTENSVWVRR